MLTRAVCAFSALFISAAVFAGNEAQWAYTGEEGPENWAKLSPLYSACEGRNQSPVNLTDFTEADLPPIRFNYVKGAENIVNNGHTIQVNFDKRSSIEIDGRTFSLIQYHFHAPGENEINGKSYPMEAHFVHSDKDGNLAVLALLFEEGAENKSLTKVWEHLPEKTGDNHALTDVVSANELLPKSRDYYRYDGSLTTPPCSEGVRWLVFKEPVYASKKQIDEFRHIMHHPNNRPIQPTNARLILK